MIAPTPPRTFKTAGFSRAAHKARIGDEELCRAIEQVRSGQAVDLGGGVFKKRLDKNRRRAIVIARGERLWVYEYLFAKKDRDNIAEDELTSFRRLARIYAGLSRPQVDRLVEDGDWLEICRDRQA